MLLLMNEEKVKKGIQTLFQSNNELASIGTEEQYYLYYQSIFPNTEYPYIAYHGAYCKFEEFEIRRRDAYLVDNVESAQVWAESRSSDYGGVPYVYAFKVNKTSTTSVYIDDADEFEPEGTKNIIFENTEDIHMLGNKKDMINFARFVKDAS